MVRENAARRHSSARSRCRSHRTFETRLPLSLRPEICQPGKAQHVAARHAGLHRAAENPAYPGDCGCGRVVADVRVTCTQDVIRHSPGPTEPGREPNALELRVPGILCRLS